MKYILILFYIGKSMSAVEFNNKEACEAALRDLPKLSAYAKGICVPKGSVE